MNEFGSFRLGFFPYPNCFLFGYAFTYPVIQFDGFVAFLVCSSQLERNEITNSKPHSHCYNNWMYLLRGPPTHAFNVCDGQIECVKIFRNSFSPLILASATTISFINVYVNGDAICQWRKYSRKFILACRRWRSKNILYSGKISLCNFFALRHIFKFIRMPRVTTA